MGDFGDIHRIKNDKSRSGDGDTVLGRFAKLIPAEALLIYPIGKAASPDELLKYWPLVVIVLVVILRSFTISGGKRLNKIISILISLVAFLFWVLANGDQIGPIAPTFPYSDVITIWGGLFWLALASIAFKGD